LEKISEVLSRSQKEEQRREEIKKRNLKHKKLQKRMKPEANLV
jgi:hypothetical protein